MTRRARILAPLLLATALAGCDIYTHEPDAGPPSLAQPPLAAAPRPAPAVARAPTETSGGRVTVRPGQTLYAVSREQGVPVRALIDANGLVPPYGLRAGQVLVVPHIRQYVVQPGDTLHDVARRFDVEAATLVRLNHLAPPYLIRIGLPLILPPRPALMIAEGEAPPRPAEPAYARPVPTAPPTATGPGPVPPPASEGQRFGAVALAPPPAAPPPALNHAGVSRPLPAPQALEPPTLPQSSASPATVAPPYPLTPPAAPAVARSLPSAAQAGPPAAPSSPAPPPERPHPVPAAAAPPPEPESGVPSPAQSGATAPAVAAIVADHRPPTAPLFYWPVRGKLLSAFGPAAGGTHNDGINIAAPAGSAVDAAESGVVAYAGDELRGFGNLLLIKHADGWITAYAHNKTLLVKKGDHVRRGQAIATVGSSGGVGQPQLHFELRQGTKAIDPLDHLPPPGDSAG